MARVGDLRHHFIFYWPDASLAPWGGIANWNADPLTGQIVGAAATNMGRSVTYASAQNRDIMMVANGELDMSDITNGVPASLRHVSHGPETESSDGQADRQQDLDGRHQRRGSTVRRAARRKDGLGPAQADPEHEGEHDVRPRHSRDVRRRAEGDRRAPLLGSPLRGEDGQPVVADQLRLGNKPATAPMTARASLSPAGSPRWTSRTSRHSRSAFQLYGLGSLVERLAASPAAQAEYELGPGHSRRPGSL